MDICCILYYEEGGPKIVVAIAVVFANNGERGKGEETLRDS